MQLNDKVIVITGASSGIGALAAQMLSREGATVVLAARSADKLQTVGRGMMGPYHVVEMDVASDASVAAGFADLQAVRQSRRACEQCGLWKIHGSG